LNVAAFNVMQLGHCLGGAPDACSLGPGFAGADFIMVVADSLSSGREAPQERQDPTSVSLKAPHFGQFMRLL
jgi:hypothetical protein